MNAVLLPILAVVVACTHASNASLQLSLQPKADKGRITGGSNAARNQFPYQVSFQLEMLGAFEHFCGGSILSPTHVLTAGQCITNLPQPANTRVVAGVLSLDEDGVAVDVAETLVHPDYEGGLGPNDLALIRLASALAFSESIQPIGLPSPDVEPAGRAVFSGWGSTNNDTFNPIRPDVLQYVDVPVLTYSECAFALTILIGDSKPLDETSNVCTGPLHDGISTCAGDSGGPLAQQETNELIGVVSWGIIPCGYSGSPSIFTKVSNFVGFIRANVPDLPDSSLN